MKPFNLFLTLFIIPTFIGAQSDLQIELTSQSKIDAEHKQCIRLVLKSEESTVLSLSSQNYRMYYNVDNLSLDEASLAMQLPEDKYQIKLVQHVPGIDASGIGLLPFEKNLGFINLSIVHNNVAVPGIPLNAAGLPIADMCFTVKDWKKPMSVVLARQDMTSAYGRAFIEVSSLDANKSFVPMKIKTYKDYIVQ
jgi:hypothetical protein